jgi:hypothetical protein
MKFGGVKAKATLKPFGKKTGGKSKEAPVDPALLGKSEPAKHTPVKSDRGNFAFKENKSNAKRSTEI